MKKEEKLTPGLPSGFEDRWNKQLSLKKKLLDQEKKGGIYKKFKNIFADGELEEVIEKD